MRSTALSLITLLVAAFAAVTVPFNAAAQTGYSGDAEADPAANTSVDAFERVAPEKAGFSPERLDELARFLEEAGSSALMLVHDGKVVFEWGDVYRPHTVHSIRKALLNSIFGIYATASVIDTSATLADLGIDDVEPGLTDRERSARVADLLKSRSGVYHPAAANSLAMNAAAPQRGAFAPGEAYHYNNWDFNALGTIFERETETSIFTAFRDRIARPLGMLQYEGTFVTIDGSDPDTSIPDTDGFYQQEGVSRHPAYHFRMSAHDLALYGMLYLQGGRWNGEQIVPEDWIEASTKAYSVTNERVGIGYGLLWNVLMETETRSSRSFYHTGVGRQMLAVYPAARLVLVHRVDTERPTDFKQQDLYRIISLVFAAQEGA